VLCRTSSAGGMLPASASEKSGTQTEKGS